MNCCKICSTVQLTSDATILKQLDQMIVLDSKEVTIAQAIKTCFNIQIPRYVGGSNLICMACLKQVYRSTLFKKKCKLAATYLETANEISMFNDDDDNDDNCLINDFKINDISLLVDEEEPITFVNRRGFITTDTFIEEIQNPELMINEMKKLKSTHVRLCEFCGTLLTRKSYLEHIKFSRCRGIKQVKNIKCPQCDSLFHNSVNLTTHVETVHQKNLLCSFCARVFGKYNHLVVHMRQHTGETPYKCELCECSFKQRILLRNHMKSTHHQTLAHSYRPKPGNLSNENKEENANTIKKIRKKYVYPKKPKIEEPKMPPPCLPEELEDPKKEVLCHLCAQFIIHENLAEHTNAHKFDIVFDSHDVKNEMSLLSGRYHNFITDNPLKCEFCSLQFMENIALQQHVLHKHTVHINKSVNVAFIMDFDDEQAEDKRNNPADMLMISEVKTMKRNTCNFCNKHCSKSDLARHIKANHLQLKVLCDICGVLMKRLKFYPHVRFGLCSFNKNLI